VASATGNHAATMFSANKECPLRHVRYYSDALGSGQHFLWNTVIWCGHDLVRDLAGLLQAGSSVLLPRAGERECSR